MSPYGLTSTGFNSKSLAVLLAEIEAKQKADIDPLLDVSAEGPVGQLNAPIAEKLAELWEVALAVYRAFDPDQNTGEAQDAVCAITGVVRLAAVETTVTIHCTGTAATVLTVGRVISTGADDRFESTTQKTLLAADAWAINTVYALTAIVSNDSNIYECVQAGTSAGAGGPTGTGDDIVDNTCKWNFVGDGTAFSAVPFQAEETGPVQAYEDAIDTEDSIGAIETPVSGWDDARNLSDGTLGRDVETNAALRLRREELLVATGTATVDAIRADVLTVSGVTACRVFENVTDVTDSDGLPLRSIEVVVLGGVLQDIADQIWDSKGDGIRTYGSESETVTDSQGDSHTIDFSRPDEKAVHTKLTYTTDSDYPSDGDAQVKAAVVAWGTALGIGTDVVEYWIGVTTGGISGVVDVTEVLIGFADPPVASANLTIGSRELSTWLVADVDLVVT